MNDVETQLVITTFSELGMAGSNSCGSSLREQHSTTETLILKKLGF